MRGNVLVSKIGIAQKLTLIIANISLLTAIIRIHDISPFVFINIILVSFIVILLSFLYQKGKINTFIQNGIFIALLIPASLGTLMQVIL